MIQISEIMQGYVANEASKNALLCLLNLARELRADRVLVVSRDGDIRYVVEDMRYISLSWELRTLLSQLPSDLTDRVRSLSVNYLKSLYASDDMIFITA